LPVAVEAGFNQIKHGGSKMADDADVIVVGGGLAGTRRKKTG